MDRSFPAVLLICLVIIPFGRCQQEDCKEQADIAFVVDSSGSINDRDPDNWNKIKQFISDVVNKLDIGEDRLRVGVVVYSNQGIVEFLLNTYYNKAEMMVAIRNMKYGGGNTNTSGGIYKMLTEIFVEENGDRRSVKNTGIVITDGVSTRDSHLTIPYAAEAKRRNIRMLAVGIGDDVNLDELEGIASTPDKTSDQTVFPVANFYNLTNIINKLVTQTCTVVTTPGPTSTPIPDPSVCREQVDVVVALDASGSVGYGNFERMKTFTSSMVETLDIDSGTVRFGLLVFASNPERQFQMSSYNNRGAMLPLVDQAPYLRGTTNTASAIQYAYSNMFTPSHGDRNGVKNVLVIVTNGSSDDKERTLNAAREARKRGIHIFVVAVGNWLDIQEMNGMATYPYEENKFHLEGFGSLDDELVRTMKDLVCNTQNECASNPCINAMLCNDALGYFHCTCSEGYAGPTCSQRCRNPQDIVFALDASGSIGKENFERMVDFVRTVIDGIRIGNSDSSRPARVGVIIYSSNAEVLFHLNEFDNKESIQNALPPYYKEGTTNTAEAIRMMRTMMFTSNNGDQPNARNIGIVMTDGRSNNEEETWNEAVKTRAEGIDLISIGIGSSIRKSELEGIASAPNEDGENVLLADNFSSLDNLRNALVDIICNNEDECERFPCLNGGRCTDQLNRYSCDCNEGYSGNSCENRCSDQMDIVFAIDKSGSIRHERFPIVLDYVRDIISQLDVGLSKTRIGAVSWSDSADLEFDLNDYVSKQDVLQAVRYIKYSGGRTNTAAALNLVRSRLFSQSNGDRSNVENILIIISDGNSNINPDQTIEEAIKLRVNGVHVMTASVGTQINRMELRGMASENKGDNMMMVESFTQMDRLIEPMFELLCDEVNNCQNRPCRNGGVCVEGRKTYTCQCPEGRTGYNCQFSCRNQLDLAIILDMSGSTEEEHERAVEFAERLIYSLDMNFQRAKIGLITYGDSATVQFDLNEYSTKPEVLNALSFLPNKGKTNTQAALSLARNRLLTSSGGGRNGVTDVAVVITDGYSNINQENTIPEAERLRNNGAVVYVVAIGDEIDIKEINGIAGRSGFPSQNFVYKVPENRMINEIADQLGDSLCSL